MRGLWNVQTQGIPPKTGLLAWDWILAVGTLIITILFLLARPRQWGMARLLDGGFLVLCVYFFLHAIDLTIRFTGKPLKYSYICFTSFNAALRTLSDVLVLAGYWQTMERFQTPYVANLLSLCRDPKVRKDFIMPEIIPIGLLWVLGLYQVGLQFALCFAWLGFVDLGIIDALARARSGVEVGFAALYFITLGIMGLCIFFGNPTRDNKIFTQNKPLAVMEACRREPLKHEHLDEVKEVKRAFNDSFAGAVLAGALLGARSFCEIVIVGQLDRWPANILAIYQARDVCYGVFSGAFLLAIFGGIPWPETRDPWEVDNSIAAAEEAEARAEAELLQAKLQAALDSWPDEAHQRFKAKVEGWTRNGQTSAPDVGQIFDALRNELRNESKGSPAQGSGDYRLLEGRLEFLNTMQGTVSDWVPIYKWDGRDHDETRSK